MLLGLREEEATQEPVTGEEGSGAAGKDWRMLENVGKDTTGNIEKGASVTRGDVIHMAFPVMAFSRISKSGHAPPLPSRPTDRSACAIVPNVTSRDEALGAVGGRGRDGGVGGHPMQPLSHFHLPSGRACMCVRVTTYSVFALPVIRRDSPRQSAPLMDARVRGGQGGAQDRSSRPRACSRTGLCDSQSLLLFSRPGPGQQEKMGAGQDGKCTYSTALCWRRSLASKLERCKMKTSFFSFFFFLFR
ncbi:hypothetical protein B0I35DRAFT_433119 [Stachybotrys elegans]|uniref:Uncharacterized protein n=1 Tax=Stachybotrys elegans TaxID=80388 RepID=A0A8K0SPJ9_9HYPO|nr:hypothetical protein B0I35DRAFT_433119 [Stachybotrys elegans]